MLVSIHLVARLLRMPILRIDGDILLVDDDRLGTAPERSLRHHDERELTAGRLLALAEAEMATVEEQRRRRAAS